MKKTKITALLLSLAMLSSAAMPGTLAIESAADGSAEYECGFDYEHTHDEGCYDAELTCTEEESAGHTHGEDCYTIETVLNCDLTEEPHECTDECYEQIIAEEPSCGNESEEHEHNDDCYAVEEVQVCEPVPHEHDDGCYIKEKIQTCEEPETEGHTHGDGCYSEPVLVCTTEEHTHDESCLPEPEVCDSCGMEVDSCICCEFCDGTTDAHDEDCELYVCPDCNVTGGHADDCITLCTCEPVDGVHLEGCKFYEVPAVYCEQCYNILEECACCTDCGVMAEEVHLNTCVNYEQGTSAEYLALCESVVKEAQAVLASLELLENPEEGVIYDFTAESLLEQVSAIWTQIDDAETTGTVTMTELDMVFAALEEQGIDLWDIEDRLNALIEAEITEDGVKQEVCEEAVLFEMEAQEITSVGGVVLDKKVSLGTKEDEYILTLEAFTTGEVIHATTGNKVDIILVLDMSKQMQTGNRLEEMKKAANSFINSSITSDGSRRIALVPYNATASVISGSKKDDDAALVPVTSESAVTLTNAVNALSAPAGASNIDQGMKQAAHIFQDGNSKVPADRQRIVILLSAGVFGSGNLMQVEGKDNSNRTKIRENNIEDLRVGERGLLLGSIIKTARGEEAPIQESQAYFNGEVTKEDFIEFVEGDFDGCGAELYCVGIGMPKAILGSEPYGGFKDNYKDSDAFWKNYGVLGTMINEVMYRMSSHRPDSSHVGGNQYNSWEKDWESLQIENGYDKWPAPHGFWEGHYWDNYTRNVHENFPTKCDKSYFITADDASKLSTIFETINQNIGQVTTSLESTAVIKDIVTDSFEMPEIPEGGDVRDVVKVYTMDYTGAEFDESTETEITDTVTVTMDMEQKTVSVTGYEFDKNFVTSEPRDSDEGDFFGKKIIIEFHITAAETTEGQLNVPTNEPGSGIYSGDGTEEYGKFPVPHVDIFTTVTVSKVIYADGQPTQTQGEFEFDITYTEFTEYEDIGQENGGNYLKAESYPKNAQGLKITASIENTNFKNEKVLVGSTITVREKADETDMYDVYVSVDDGVTWLKLEKQDGYYTHTGTVTVGMNILFRNEIRVTSLTVTKIIPKATYEAYKNVDAHQSFLFEVLKNDTETPIGVVINMDDLEVTDGGDYAKSVTIGGLLVGDTYTVTEDTDWSWRYEAEENEREITLAVSGNEVSITNTRKDIPWLDGNAQCINVFNTLHPSYEKDGDHYDGE